MAYYLQLNGTSDNLKTPSIAFNEVILDFIILPIGGSTSDQYYIDARTGITNSYVFYRPTTPADLTSTSSPWLLSGGAVYVDGVQKTNASSLGIPKNQRTTLRLVLNAVGTDDVCLFSNNTNGNRSNVNVYRVTFKNAGVVVADYDMNTQTVIDQSGNGNNATLTGGTWVSDASTTPVAGGGTLTGTGSLTATGSNNISGGAALTGLGSLTASGVNTIAGSSAMTASGSLTASGSVAISGGATLTATGSLTASGVVSILGGAIAGGATLTAVGRLTASGRVVAPKMIEYERRLAAARAGRRLTTVELIALQQLRKR